MRRALLVCVDKYPNGDAGAVRTHVLALLLKRLGISPTVVGLGPSTNFEFKINDDIEYLSLRSPSQSFISRFLNISNFHKRLKKSFMNKDDEKWDLILFSDVSKNTLKMLKHYSKKNGAILVHDSVEWYSPEQFSTGKLHPTYIKKDKFNKYWIDKNIRVIAISSYLEKHFSKKVITTRIPVIMDVHNTPCEKNVDENKTVVVYAGSPGKKDYLSTVIAGFAKVDTEVSYELRLIGITKDQLVSLCGADPKDIEAMGEHLVCLGRVSRDKVIENLSQADFTVLMRSEEQRYAKAGFPTKFVESLATATPVIANATSDLAEYLKDGVNGYLVSDSSSEALAEALNRAFKLSFDERTVMQKNARNTAIECFDYSEYEDKLEKIILD